MQFFSPGFTQPMGSNNFRALACVLSNSFAFEHSGKDCSKIPALSSYVRACVPTNSPVAARNRKGGKSHFHACSSLPLLFLTFLFPVRRAATMGHGPYSVSHFFLSRTPRGDSLYYIPKIVELSTKVNWAKLVGRI